MKMKLAATLAVIVLGLAGCGGATNTSNTGNSTNSANRPANTSNATSSTTATPDPNMVKANANASDEVGGTKEGCKCSAAGMKCATKAGEKGCDITVSIKVKPRSFLNPARALASSSLPVCAFALLMPGFSIIIS